MSKPNLLGFSSSVGIYRNKRIRDLRRLLAKQIKTKIDFCDLAPLLFQVAMAYAGENEIDGNFAGYEPEDWAEIFAVNHVHLDIDQVSTIVKDFHQVGLFKDNKIRSWSKYNRHFGEHEKIVRAKRLAGKVSAQKRLLDAKKELQNEHENPEKSAQKVEKNSSKSEEKSLKKSQKSVQKNGGSEGGSRQIWLLNQAILAAKSPKARRALEVQKAQLLGGMTGVDLNAPIADQVKQAKHLGMSPADWEQAQFDLAKQVLSDFPEGLTESMIETLLVHGHSLPTWIQRRFGGVVERMRNPVPD